MRDKRFLNPYYYLIFISIAIYPSLCFADAAAPIINYFGDGFALGPFFVLGIVILVEWFLLWLILNRTQFHKHLYVAFIINIISSLLGTLFFILFPDKRFTIDEFFNERYLNTWSFTKVLFPFFVVTLIVEFPFIYLFYRKSISWIKAIRVTIVTNVVSYTMIFIVEIIFLSMIFAVNS